MLGFSINIPEHLRNTHEDWVAAVGHLTHSSAHQSRLLSPGQQCKWVGTARSPESPLQSSAAAFTCLSWKSAFPQQRKTYSILEQGEKPIIFPPIHSAHCLCRDLLRVVEDILLYITEMQLNSMGEGEGHRVQAPASSVFLLIYWVTQGRELCAAISSLENRDVGHSAL